MGSDGEGPIPPDVRSELLAAERRTLVLEILAERPEPVPVWDLATIVCARERDVDTAVIEAADTRAVRDELFESHLPKLAVTGIIEYDSMLGAIRLMDAEIVDYLE